jgi:hypothetical protein
LSLSRGIQNIINNHPVKQIYFVNIQQVLVCLGQDTALKQNLILLNRYPLTNPTHYILNPGIERQFNQPHWLRPGNGITHAQLLSALAADRIQAEVDDILGLTPVFAGTALDYRHQIDQAAHGRRLGRTPGADQEHTTNRPVNQGQQEGDLHFGLADNGQERIS